MDRSRLKDLEALKERMNDHNLPIFKRQQAWRAYEKIKEMVRDPRLADLRFELTNAIKADDVDEAEKIEMRINDYSRKRGWK